MTTRAGAPATPRRRTGRPRAPPGRRRADELLEGLTAPQEASVIHRGGPLLIVAGAGSGKTRVLTRRIAHLIATGDAAPWQILAITFTNKAADEMRRRVADLVGPRAERMWVSTFHSACVRILRAHGDRLGYKGSLHHLRRRRLAPAGRDHRPRARHRHEEAVPPLDARPDQPGQVAASRARTSSGPRRSPSSTAGSPTSSTSTSGACWRPTPWTSTTCCSMPSVSSTSTPTSSSTTGAVHATS